MFSSVSSEARCGFVYKLSVLAFLIQIKGSKVTGFNMASKYSTLKAHSQFLLLSSPIKNYLLIAG